MYLLKKIIFRPILKLFSLLPMSILRKIGALVGIAALKLSNRAANRLKSNLITTGMCVEKDVEEMAKLTAIELGKTITETVCIAWQRSRAYNASFFKRAINFAVVEAACAQDKPIVFLTPHIGNFEMAVKYTANRIKRDFTILYKPEKDQWFNEMMLNGRSEDNIIPVPTNRQGVLTLVKSLKDNGIIGILPDNVASTGDGVWVNFFGKPVFATTLAAKLMTYNGATTFLVASYRIKDGFEIEYIPFKAISEDVQVIMREMYYEFEKMILKAPAQYFWSYNRFRVPKHASLEKIK